MTDTNAELENLRAELRGMEALVVGVVFSLIQRRIFTPEMIIREVKHTEAQLLMMKAPEGTISIIRRMREAIEENAKA